MLQVHRLSAATLFRSPLLDSIERVVHGFSTRSLPAGRPGNDPSATFNDALGLSGWPVRRLKQIHSHFVHRIDATEFADRTPEGDALYTGLEGVALEVRTADCVPVLIAARNPTVVAAAHAGWRGTSEGLVRRLVDRLHADVGVSPGDLAVAIGPHIGVCCMEVGEDVYQRFADPNVFERKVGWEKPHLNLAAANYKQLLEAGVRPGSIQLSELCTRCRSDLFHSYRRDGDLAGRMLAVIGLEP